ncbi:serine/threonine protein kinase [[Phormidium ambiguum] IAM M-71]|uniref:non-specific serine/threonine protein kinase n=1 Tax=[Phormidium ambiguum] IAM M-71 TaxID=454136 RepID=A0A1U7I7S9_9CYAN|nr:serine/threonine-protein kinase [Phormidium ambiguum]OKH32472.1 serine/threonine protein kinase [Phormidium ambiguum IAM M-71]
MMPIYCSKGHENAHSNLYCQQCGEKLDQPVAKGVYPGLLLGDRYRIVRQLGQGGFGRSYLAEDSNRFNEPCVLKEFAPQVQGTYALQKAVELFEREAGILYKLQHSQIPKFRELFRAKIQDEGHLFLVQDYIEGETYRALLEARKRQGQRFTEAEVQQLMLQLLPVLDYIHGLGVIHRDISPDNIILRNTDNFPVLIDFGGVKEVAANAESQFTQSAPNVVPSYATRLGKVGYAPHEQMQVGIVQPHSDLYALAATVLVLLTGKEPQQLIDPHNMTWNWRQEINLSPSFGMTLDKMLAYRPGDRYQSAREVLQLLGGSINSSIPVTQTSTSATTQGTIAVSPAGTQAITNSPPNRNQSSSNSNGWFGKVLAAGLVIAIASGIGLALSNSNLFKKSRKPPRPPVEQPIAPEPPISKLSPQEQARKNALRDRRTKLGIDYNFFLRLVNESFWKRNPNQRGKVLSDEPKDEQLRNQWDRIASEWLDKLTFLSSESRLRLGSYTVDDRLKWKAEVNDKKLSSRALYDIADAAFLWRFPEQKGKNFIDKPIGQVWQGIVFDKVNAVKSGTALQRIVFPPGEIGDRVSGTLKPGEGKAYIAGLAAGQIMNVKLQADSKVLFSVYPPTSDRPALLDDSTKRTWSGTLPQGGFYEFVVVSTAAKPVDYQITLTAENPPPPPEPTPIETPTPTPTPTETPPAEPTPTETPIPTETPTAVPTSTPVPTPSETPPNNQEENL